MSVFNDAEKSVLVAAARGAGIGEKFAPVLDIMGAAGLVVSRVPAPGGWRVALSREGTCIARLHLDFARYELWNALYQRLIVRGTSARCEVERRRLYKRGQNAYRRAVEALKRFSPEATEARDVG